MLSNDTNRKTISSVLALLCLFLSLLSLYKLWVVLVLVDLGIIIIIAVVVVVVHYSVVLCRVPFLLFFLPFPSAAFSTEQR